MDDYNIILKYFIEKNYSVFLIDEILPECRPSCRNSLAFHNSIFNIKIIEDINEHIGRKIMIPRDSLSKYEFLNVDTGNMEYLKINTMEDRYNRYLSKSVSYYYSNEVFFKYYGGVPKQRDFTFNKCLNHFQNKDFINIVELGTSRSFVDGRFPPGVCSTDSKFWKPNEMEKWDWSSGLFTKYFSDILTERKRKFKITSVDIDCKAIEISKIITQNNNKNIEYVTTSSEDFISRCSPKTIDLLYIDTGSMDESTALLHLREAKLLVKYNILKDDGLILIDDVKNPYMIIHNITTNKFGKSKYALSYLLENGYKIDEDEYQIILRR